MGNRDILSVTVVFYLLRSTSLGLTTTESKTNKASIVNECSSDNGSDALMVSHTVLSASTTTKWIIYSGASCLMCCDSELFDKLEGLTHPIDVSVGDGRSLKATRRGIISLNMKLSDEKLNKCRFGLE